MENRFLVGLILIAGFIMAVSVASLYAQSHILEGTICGCEFPIELLIPLLSSTGLLVGTLAYYFMSSQFKIRERMDLLPLLSLLPSDQQLVLKTIIKSGGKMAQSRIVSNTGLNKVKVSRVVSDLEAKGVVKKTTSGVTNIVELEEKFRRVLI